MFLELLDRAAGARRRLTHRFGFLGFPWEAYELTQPPRNVYCEDCRCDGLRDGCRYEWSDMVQNAEERAENDAAITGVERILVLIDRVILETNGKDEPGWTFDKWGRKRLFRSQLRALVELKSWYVTKLAAMRAGVYGRRVTECKALPKRHASA